ncbi:MAG: SusD/RagB family nutrient-binding outer membrane lipoprotein [Gemmatimonadaceae bacterium]
MRQNFITASAGLVLALGVAACNADDLTNLNKDPNNPSDVPTPTLFTNATANSVGRWLGSGYDLRMTEFIAQHLAEVQYPDEDAYRRTRASQTSTFFNNGYASELTDLQKVREKNPSDAGITGPARILQTWVFGYLTDSYGDIPYFDALKGSPTAPVETLSPKYDPQKDIYNDFFAVLDQVSKDLQTGATGDLGQADLIYGGNTAKWQRFANSLRARYALRLVNKDPATASAQLTAAFNAPGGVFTSNADNAELKWPGDGIYNNPWAADFATRDDHRISRVMMEILRNNNDPRMPVLAQPAVTDGAYRGAPNALNASGEAPYITAASRIGEVLYPGATAAGYFGGGGNAWPSYLMTYAEVAFIQAEAAARGLGGLTPAQAPAFYNAAITASMNQWGVSGTPVTTFLAQPSVVLQAGTPGLIQIAEQKWLALFTDGGQAWAEWRRTCRPATVKPGSYGLRANVPRRFQYSTTERAVNDAARLAAVAQMDAVDTFGTATTDEYELRMYWDTNPTAAPTYFVGCGNRTLAPSPAP